MCIRDSSETLRAAAAAQGIAPAAVDPIIDGLLRGHVPPGAEALAPLIQPEWETFFDYLPQDTLILVEEPEEGAARTEQLYTEIEANHAAAVGERLTVELETLLLDPPAITAALDERRPIALERLDVVDAGGEAARRRIDTRTQEDLRRALAAARSHDRALAPLAESCREWLGERFRVCLLYTSPSPRDKRQSRMPSSA